MTSACSSSTRRPPSGSAATAIATICWASTSSALRGTTVGSIAPSRIRRATTAHSSRSPRNFGKIRPMLDLADAVAGAPDALQPARDRLRRLDLQHEIDGAHVDAELQRAGRDQARQLAGLQQLLDLRALLARERAVVGARDLDRRRASAASPPSGVHLRRSLRGELVQPQREALGGAAVVDEDDRRAVLAHELEQLRVDRRPDRARASTRRRAAGSSGSRVLAAGALPGSAIDSTGTSMRRSSGLRTPGVDDRHLASGADEEAPDLLERASASRSGRSAARRARARRACACAPGARA